MVAYVGLTLVLVISLLSAGEAQRDRCRHCRPGQSCTKLYRRCYDTCQLKQCLPHQQCKDSNVFGAYCMTIRKCSNMNCEPHEMCVEFPDGPTCVRNPCYLKLCQPGMKCVVNGEIGTCELDLGPDATEPTPTTTPTCSDLGCPDGYVCREVAIQCIRAPCPSPMAQCVPVPTPPTCTGGRVFQTCASACPRTCTNPRPICTKQCVQRCACPRDIPYVHKDQCIDAEQCLMELASRYYRTS
ncbi:zonadhesin-like [Lingula anatina]|uniref:Zonadhesin-like n=1 Tax=Lingula anatina TaxID=7574 RepID=A0A1S3IU73_LINAN|nr:zonadhesin-like [Lingula anatina]|eukprot:XP_013401623.1 zonadhesin-like [Lingula anatina]